MKNKGDSRVVRGLKKGMVLLLALLLFLQPIGENYVKAEEKNGLESSIIKENYTIIVETVSEWQNHANIRITLKNTGNENMDNWHLWFTCQGNIENIWNATVCRKEEDRYAVRNNIWNQDVPVGQSITFGFTYVYTAEKKITDFELCTKEVEVPSVEYEYTTEFNKTGDDALYDAVLVLHNISANTIEDWKLSFDINGEITQVYNGEILNKEGNRYIVKNAVHNQNIASGESLRISFQGTKQEGVEENLDNIVLTQIVFDESCMDKGKKEPENPGHVSDGNEDISGGDEDASDGDEDISGGDGDVSDGDADISDGDARDTDGDGIGDEMEKRIGWNPENPDTDVDGIPDGYTLHVLYPLLLESGLDESRGILAGDDYDKDGLTNLEEYVAGTNPGMADTDGDGLTDYEELIKYGTDPLNADTDKDGMSDGSEIKLQLNPLTGDTDGNGIPDGKETLEQHITFECVENVDMQPELFVTGRGDIGKQIQLREVSLNEKFSGGLLVGQAFDFVHSEQLDFDRAELYFPINKEKLANAELSDLAICYYDEAKGTLEFLETERDETTDTLKAEVSHFSTYVVVNQGQYQKNLLDSYEMKNAVYYNGNAYFIIDEEMPYGEARDYCEKLGGRILTNPTEQERDFLENKLKKGTNGEYYFNLSNTSYQYHLYTEKKYRSAWLTNYCVKKDIYSELPLFAVKYGSETKDQNIPVSYYGIFAYADDRKNNIKYISTEERNIHIDRYTWKMTIISNPDGTSEVIMSDKLYDSRDLEKEVSRVEVFDKRMNYDEFRKNHSIGSVPAYTTFSTDIPIFGSIEDAVNYFEKDDRSGLLNQEPIAEGRGIGKKFFICKIENCKEKEEANKRIMLSTGEMVTLAEDPEKGDATVDTDGDGVPDLLELVEKIYITIPGTNKQAEAWTYRSNPVKRDTDGDGFSDREDPAPMSYDITIKNAYGNVVKLNTDAVWSILGMDINEFYENYYIRYDSPATKDIWESYKRILDQNRERFYTPEELAFLIPIDLNGAKDYIKDKPEEYKEAVYLRLHVGEELSGENIREKTEKFFTVKTKGQIWLDYVQTSLRQLVMGKYTTERNSLGTLGEIGIAFTGADFLADCRDLSYDIENWEFTWEHAGETVLDAIGLLPVIGTAKRAVKISKTDELFAIVKVGDYVFSFRRLGNISELLSQNGWKYLSKDLALAGSAGSGMDILGDDLYYYILKSCDDMDDYKYLYNNPVMDAFQKHADEIKYLQETNPDKIDDIIDSAKASGIKDADELADFTADAIEARKKGELVLNVTPARPADNVLDADFLKNANTVKDKLPTWAKNKGNFGYSEVDIYGLDNTQFFAHSSIQTEIPGVGISIKPESSPFKTVEVNGSNVINGEGAWLRDVDTEYKILSDIQSKLENNFSVSGKIKLYTELEPCPSCQSVIEQFKEMYPNIDIEVLYSVNK